MEITRNLQDAVEEDTLCIFRATILRDGQQHTGEFGIYCEDEYYYLLSNWSTINGSRPYNWEQVFETGMFTYSWNMGDDFANVQSWIDVLNVYEHIQVFIEEGTESEGTASEGTASGSTETPMVREFINKKYSTDNLYVGQRSYHTGAVFNAPKKAHDFLVGVELEVEFDDEDDRETFNEMHSNWFYREFDGSLGGFGCEIITIPLLPNDAKDEKTWEPLCGTLTRLGASSWDTGRCGLHVHIGREAFGRDTAEQRETLGKLLFLYQHELNGSTLNTRIFGRSRSYNENDGKTEEGYAVKLLSDGDAYTNSVLKDKKIQEKVGEAMREKCRYDRYFDINTRNSRTIEFRKGRGSLKPKRIAAIVEYCLLMVRWTRRTPWTNLTYGSFTSYLQSWARTELLKELVSLHA